MTRRKWNHIEAVAQNLAGTVIAQIIFWSFSIPISTAILLNVVLIITMYIKTYSIRSLFDRHAR